MNVRVMKHLALLQEWEIKIGDCRGSGKSVSTWCRENGINVKTYYYWERKYLCEASQKNYYSENSQRECRKESSKSAALVRVHPEKLPQSPLQESLLPQSLLRESSSAVSPSLISGSNTLCASPLDSSLDSSVVSPVLIRCGNACVELPANTRVDIIAALVTALNHHA